SVRGVRVACMLREQDGQVRGSLRAKDATDVSVVAAKFEGGGHKAAAGFTVRGSMNDALRLVKKELTDLF
ncbi:MAG: DHHA1 domain-containing protein, partial [Eggerthellaceae bacterium]|nr:DHHA1 domain-containing protein [Eggerthellaceae bacterium]